MSDGPIRPVGGSEPELVPPPVAPVGPDGSAADDMVEPDDVRTERHRLVPVDGGQAPVGDPHGELLARVVRGDEAAFADLYDALAPRVHGTVLRVLRDPAMAEEVTQEVFVELWRTAPRHDATRARVATWAVMIAHRRAVDRVRSEQASRQRDDRVAAEAEPADPGPSGVVVDRLEAERVRQALHQLTDLQRDAITLAYYGGHSYREVARRLDVPEGTVKTRIRDGLIRFRDTLGVTP